MCEVKEEEGTMSLKGKKEMIREIPDEKEDN